MKSTTLEQEQTLLRMLFDAMPQLGWTAAADGFVDYYNRGWYEYSGTTYEEMKGWGWTSIHDPKELPRVLESWNGSIATGKAWEIEFPLRRHDGVYRWFLSRATPIYDGEGKLLRWVGINTDIDDQKRAEAKLAELDRAKTTFFNNVSHELRTPLLLILAPIEQALKAHPPILAGDELLLAHRNAERLLRLVNTLLDFSRIEAGRLHACFEPIDLARYTRDLASLFASSMERAGLRFVNDMSPLPGLVSVDAELWEKIVVNLLQNALKFTFEGEVAVRLSSRGKYVELAVSDTGVGIPADELPRIFERFHRVRGTKSRSHEGTGIGLALVKELAELHGGTATITSTIGVGTCVRVLIPNSSSPHPQEGRLVSATPPSSNLSVRAQSYATEATSWLSAPTQPASAPSPPKPETAARILVVDDNRDVCEFLTRLLGRHYHVVTARNGTEALATIAAELPSLILSDVMMPEMDGIELVRAVRKNPATRALPIILSSARAGDDNAEEGMRAGANDYIIKPFAAGELVARVAAQLEIARINREKTDEAQEARAQAESANRAKDEFLAMLGHELRNPLAPIVTALHLMQMGGETERPRRIIERQVGHLVRLIDDLLDVSRITRGKITLRREPIELAEVVAKAIEMASPLLEKKGHELEVEVPRESLTVDGDCDRLAQVVSNLLTNAAKYTPDGGRIKVRAHRSGDEVLLSVRDNGVGITAEMLPKIFELFTQERQSIDRSQGGLGLGLAIVRSLVELHGGQVAATSEGAHQGAEFTVRLPAAAQKETGPPSAEPNSATADRPPLELSAPSAYRVLVVDDNRDAADGLAAVVCALGHIARAAYDGPSALALVEHFNPDFAFLDLGLPVLDGFQLGRLLGKKFPEMHLVAVTGYGQEEDKVRSGAAGFDLHLVKPIDVAAIAALLAKKLPRPQPEQEGTSITAASTTAASTTAASTTAASTDDKA